MKLIISLFTLLLFSISAFSQTGIKLEDINKHVGDSVKVCAKIDRGIYLEHSGVQ